MNRRIDPVLAIGTFLAAVSGLISYLMTDGNLTLSVVVGLQIEVLTLLTQVLAKLESKELAAGRLAKLLDKVESVSWLSEQMERICSSVLAVERRYAHTIAPDAVRRLLASTEQELRALERGTLYVDCYDPILKLQLLAGPASILRATSVQIHDLSWQLSDIGRAYWRAQKEALARGWEIRRVFVYDDWVDELECLAQEQKQEGVTVMRTRRETLGSSLQSFDVTIWGETHAFEHQTAPMGTMIVDKFTVEPNDIAHYIHLFATLEMLAEPI